MRYAASKFGEDSIALGEFATGSTVTCVLYNLSTGSAIATNSAACTEIGTTGVFRYLLSNITTKPTTFTQILYIMTDATTGRTHKGKVIVGGYPSDSAIRRYGGAVHIDTINGSAGTTFPLGTDTNPVNNVADARTIANDLGFTTYRLRGSITLTTNHNYWLIEGDDPAHDVVTVNAGVTVTESSFIKVGIRGDLSGDISAEKCLLGSIGGTVTGLSGIVFDCGSLGTLRLAAGGTLRGIGLNSQDLSGTTIDYNTPGSATSVLVAEVVGYINVKSTNSNCIFGTILRGSKITFQSTVANLTAHLYGYGEVDFGTATFLSLSDFVLRASSMENIANTVWEEATSGHTTAGSFGLLMQKLLTVAKFLGLK